MTAKEITEKLLWDENSIEWGEMMIKEYARIKCEEQRELCAIECGHPQGNEQVKLAPEPTFE